MPPSYSAPKDQYCTIQHFVRLLQTFTFLSPDSLRSIQIDREQLKGLYGVHLNMSGIPIHTQSPISAAKASKTPTSSSNNEYPSAQPGAAAPTPTQTISSTSQYAPPPPQPGTVPVPLPATITAKPSIPPPPKPGEKPKPLQYYAPVHAGPTHVATQAQPYPEQMSIPPPAPSYPRQPPASITSPNPTPSFPQPSSLYSPTEAQHQPPPTRTLPGANEGGERRSLGHPPGYVQNSHAMDMTQDQRLAIQQGNQSGSLGYGQDSSSNAGYGQEDSVWDVAKRLAKGVGDKVSEINERYGGGKS